MAMNHRYQHPKAIGSSLAKQRGAILIVCMIMLLLVTLIGVGTMDLTTREVKMTVAMQDSDRAFEAAETALSEAECWIEIGLAPYGTDCGPNSAGGNVSIKSGPNSNAGIGGVWEQDAAIGTNTSWWLEKNAKWWKENGTPVASHKHSGVDQLSAPSRYVIELVSINSENGSLVKKAGGDSGRQTFYRITARGVGVKESTVVLLQTTYGKR